MFKRIYSYTVIMAASLVLLISCNDDSSDKITKFTSNVVVTNSAYLEKADTYTMSLKFSTDNGTTFVDYPVVKVGQNYKVKVYNSGAGSDVTVQNCFDVDWSASTPAPVNVDASTGIAEFTMGQTNELKATLGDHYSPFNAASWTGEWGGDEVGACCGGTDANNIRQDTSNPNKLIMDNFWGDGVDAYMIFSPSTSLADQVVTIPTQTTSEGGVASGTGTYEQCYGTFTINTTYKIGGKTYNWQYNFHR
jgi:hypothetical protein